MSSSSESSGPVVVSRSNSADLQATSVTLPLDLTIEESVETFATRILKEWKVPDRHPKSLLLEMRSIICLSGTIRDMFKLTNDCIQMLMLSYKKEEVHNYHVQCYPVPVSKERNMYELRVNLYLNQQGNAQK